MSSPTDDWMKRVSVAEERIRRLKPKLKQSVSEEYKKVIRRQQRQLLMEIEE